MPEEMENSLSRGRYEYPINIVNAYNYALTYREDGKYASEKVMGKLPSAATFATDFHRSEKQEKTKKNFEKKVTKSNERESSARFKKNGNSDLKSTCHFCGKEGHWQRDCELLRKAEAIISKKTDRNAVSATTTDEDFTFMISENIIATVGSKILDSYDILCDNQSTVNIFHNKDLLTNIRKARSIISVNGIGGSLVVSMEGDFEGIGTVYYHPKAIANILCMHDLMQQGLVEIDHNDKSFKVKIGNQVVVFKAKGKLYVWNYKDDKVINDYSLVDTVEDMEQNFTKRQIARAKISRDMIRNLGYPSPKDFVDAIKSGAILNCPITVQDFKNSLEIYGTDLGTLKGKSTREKPRPVDIQKVARNLERDVVLAMDIMFIAKRVFLVSISRHIGLIMVTHIAGRTAGVVLKAIKSQVSGYVSKGFSVKCILVDGEGAFQTLITDIQEYGISVNIASKSEHVPEVERNIRVIKERARAVWNTVPFKMNEDLIVHLVNYVTTMINLFGKDGTIGHISPRELFTGEKVDYKVFGKLSFGDYCQISNESEITNTMEARTSGAIAIGPVGNVQGNYKFINLSSWKVVIRRTWVKLPMPSEVIEYINNRSQVFIETDEFEVPENANEVLDDFTMEKRTRQMPVLENDVSETLEEENFVDNGKEVVISPQDDLPTPELQDETQIKSAPVSVDNEAKSDGPYNLRPHRSHWQDRFSAALTNLSIPRGIKLYGDEAVKSIESELSQLHNKKAWKPIKFMDISINLRSKVVNSILFLKRKKDGRLKSRLVADGRTQERSTDVDISSPTVVTEHLFYTLGVDATEERRVVIGDVEGAYIEADMTGTVIMVLRRQLASILINLFPDQYRDYASDGNIYVTLLKALYGTIEAAKLWYENLSSNLREYGLKANPYDRCVFNLGPKEMQLTVAIHVDDLKISSRDSQAIDGLIKFLSRKYTKINITEDMVMDYLGMKVDFNSPGYVSISMEPMVKEILSDLEIPSESVASSPASNNLFNVSEGKELLANKDKERFHSLTAKLLYIAKRGRPDILTAVSFLTTRVSMPNVEDNQKLIRVAKYLNGTSNKSLHIGVDEKFGMSAYVDASYSVHPDGKSHTGCVVSFGKGAIRSSSKKQKIVCKSSTEAELVGVSDELSDLIGIRNFALEQGANLGPFKLYQDNRSAIMMAEKGRSTSHRTRHISTRYFFIKDRIESGEATLNNIGTLEMISDFFTKALQGELFKKHRYSIMGN
jgi:hypothetical protein